MRFIEYFIKFSGLALMGKLLMKVIVFYYFQELFIVPIK